MQKNNRRQFLRNTSLAVLAIGSSATAGIARTFKKPIEKPLIECDRTTLDFYGEGPFYTDNPPLLTDFQLANENEAGQRMLISGRVFNLDCSEYIPETIIDVWHANNAGQYDNSGFNLRGYTLSNEQGFYMFETIYPGKYLNGSKFRPSHIHFKVTPPGFSLLTTQLYFEGDPDLETDAASSISSGDFDASHRIISLTENNEGILEGNFDIIINGEGVTGVNDIHIDKGMLYQAGPNPFSDQITIKYGVFKNSKVSLFVFDMQGRMVANLEERSLKADKYEATWRPDPGLPNGHYFIALKINDLQVHHLKIIHQK